MPIQVEPRKLQEQVHVGFKRLRNFREARLMFIKSFCGAYYDKDHGKVMEEPLNLVFHAISSILPAIVMNHPRHVIEAKFLAFREYAEQASLELDLNSEQLNIKDVYRRAMVDACFTMGILKTGLADSGSSIAFDEYSHIDPGQLYTDNVDFDNFVVDPSVRGPVNEAAWMGDKIIMPRQMLLDSGLYNNELIERLPSIHDYNRHKDVANISRQTISESDDDMMDEVEIVELYIPSANAIVTVPGFKDTTYDDYLRVADYDGPDSGPYTFLSFTPPVPGNPIPVSKVGIWYDLHVAANKMAKKVINQALRQKDIIAYQPAAADDAQTALDSSDGDAIKVQDPSAINTLSFGGQNRSNEIVIDRLNAWFNMIAANPQGVAGQRMDANSATEAQILAQNANIGLEDMKDAVYNMAAEEAKKRFFYLHTDPLKETPLIIRRPQPGPMGMAMEERQVILTPEARSGEWIDYNLKIQPESMGRVDARTRLDRAMEFFVKVLPAVVQAAMTAMQLGMGFNLPATLIRIARDMGIDWLDETFYDPAFQQQAMMQMMSGPGFEQSLGQPAPNGGLGAVMQNGQPGQVGKVPTQGRRTLREQQMGAAESQSDNMMRETY